MGSSRKEIDKLDYISRIKILLKECDAVLVKLSASCCLPGRSERIQKLALQIDTLNIGTPADLPDDFLDQKIKEVERVGEIIGGLFVTCCAPVREPLYLKLVATLQEVHSCLWRAKGTSH